MSVCPYRPQFASEDRETRNDHDDIDMQQNLGPNLRFLASENNHKTRSHYKGVSRVKSLMKVAD